MVDVQKVLPIKDRQALVVPFPVSRTWVSQHSMLDAWRVDVFLDQVVLWAQGRLWSLSN